MTNNFTLISNSEFAVTPSECAPAVEAPAPCLPATAGEAFLKTSSGATIIIDADMLQTLSSHSWGISSHGHVRAKIGGRIVYVHRLILGAGPGDQIDHKNQNKLDNRRSNLRFCNHSQNNSNRQANKNNKSNFKGVTSVTLAGNQRFKARAAKNYVNYSGPVRRNPAAAARDYDAIARLIHGEFASLNFPDRYVAAIPEAGMCGFEFDINSIPDIARR
jgi:hypothetical protein